EVARSAGRARHAFFAEDHLGDTVQGGEVLKRTTADLFPDYSECLSNGGVESRI
ncbi:hypothetical protein Pmar_PMAR008358, partial [Perkinsus marinus ATCC 50983]